MLLPSRLRRVALPTLIAVATMVAPAAAHAVGPDPATPDPSAAGTHDFVRAEYDLPDRVTVGVGAPGTTPAPSTFLDMREAGDVYYPKTGNGPFPVLIFLHGNHATCQSGPGSMLGLLVDPLMLDATYANGDCRTDDDTSAALLAIDEARSYQGYDYLSEKLATQGYIVASLDVNDITDWTNNAAESGYLGRAEIMSKTLDLVGSWNTTTGPEGIGDALKGRVDISRVGVMGHSRGGEGVNQFVEYNQTRPANAAEAAARMDPEHPMNPEPVPDFGPKYNLKGVVSLAPVDDQGDRQPVVSGTNFATILPYCDGDVYDLEGAPVFERSKNGLSAGGFIAAQYLVNGANHDYFNTVWTEDDANLFGFGDPYCNVEAGPTRLQPAEERQIGFTLINGFLRATVGGESQFDAIVRGESLPPAACPNGGTDPVGTGPTCRNVVQTSYVAPDRRVLIAPTDATVPTTTPDGDPITVDGFDVTACTAEAGTLLVTTGCGASPNRSYGPQLTLGWTGPSKLTVTPLPAHQDISAFSTLSFRASENYTDAQQLPTEDALEVTLTDTTGNTKTVLSDAYSAALEPEPGTSARKQVVNGVRIPLSAFTGVDLTKVKTMTLGAGDDTPTGSIQFNDLALQEPGAGAPTATTSPAPTTTASPVQSASPTSTPSAGATATPAPSNPAPAGVVPSPGACRTRVAFRLYRKALRQVKRHGLRVRSTCPGRQALTFRITVSRPATRRAHLSRRLVRTATVTLAHGAATRLRIRKATMRKLLHLHHVVFVVKAAGQG